MDLFFKHPRTVCMDYQTHCKFSLNIAVLFTKAAIKAVIHAFYPDLYITSTSDLITEIQKHLDDSGCRNIK